MQPRRLQLCLHCWVFLSRVSWFGPVGGFNRRHTRMKMICSILLLLSLTSCVNGSFVLNVTQTSYQAEENHNIILGWMFPTRTSSSLNSLFIYCELFNELRPSVLFHLHGGVEDPESQDGQFTGRVRCDKDVLRDGRIRLHMSRLRINDSGVYRCDVRSGDGSGSRICRLSVTAAADESKPPRPTVRPQPDRRGKIDSYNGLTLTAGPLVVLCVGLCFAVLYRYLTKSTDNRGKIYTEDEFLRETTHHNSSAEIRSCLEGNPQAAKTCQNSCETRCPITYLNLNHSRSTLNLN